MKILKNKSYQKLLSNLEAKDRANKTWQEMYKSISEAKQNAELKLASKEKECLDLRGQLEKAEKDFILLNSKVISIRRGINCSSEPIKSVENRCIDALLRDVTKFIEIKTGDNEVTGVIKVLTDKPIPTIKKTKTEPTGAISPSNSSSSKKRSKK